MQPETPKFRHTQSGFTLSAALNGLTSASDEIGRYFTALAAKEECQARSSGDNTEMTAAITEPHAAILDVADRERLHRAGITLGVRATQPSAQHVDTKHTPHGN